MSASKRRRNRYRLLRYWRRRSIRGGGRVCMTASGMTVSVGATANGQIHVSGVQRCSSPWSCPVCAPAIRERRADEIDRGLASHLASGGIAMFVTATVRHQSGTKLADVLDLVQTSWSRMTQSNHVRRSSAYLGQIRAVEITHGRNGWHPHVHALMLFEAGTTPDEALAWCRHLGTVYADRLRKLGGDINAKGFDVRPVLDSSGVSEYLCKVDGGWGAGLELARADLKRGRKGMSPFEILERAAGGSSFHASMFAIYEAATAGKRAIVWSRGLKARLGVEDMVDEDVVELAPEDPIAAEVVVPREAWAMLSDSDDLCDLLDDVAAIADGSFRGRWTWPPDWLTSGRGSAGTLAGTGAVSR